MSKIIYGDALKCLKSLPDSSVNMCVTSPPYYGLRDYGIDGQLGTEDTPALYIERLIDIFREVHRILRKDGTLWINIADSYAGSGKGGWDSPIKSGISQQQYNPKAFNMPKKWKGIKAKDMIGIQWSLAFSLRDDGWYLRSDIIWQKPNCMPESVKDRPTKSYEHIFLLAKSKKYYYDYEAIQVPATQSSIERARRAVSDIGKYANGIDGQTMQAIFIPRDHSEEHTMRNKRDVWEVSTNSYRVDGHFAMYPEKLIEPCILAGCPVGGVVLDPFFGSGTTGAVAKRLGREYIGIDINPEYCAIAEKRIDEVIPQSENGGNNGNTN